jgi:short-subunit dehydrogenase
MKKYTLITGASRGIGKIFAEALAQRKKNLILVARSENELQKVAKELSSKYSVEAIAISLDLSKLNSSEELFDKTKNYKIETLINNAGFGVTSDFSKNNPSELEKMLVLNIVTLTKLSRLYLEQLKENKGCLINVSSRAGFQPIPFMAAYAASKAYVLHLSEALYEELKDEGVHVMALCPGATETAFWEVAQMDPQKIKFEIQSPTFVVEAALSALDKKSSVVIPGFKNNASAFATRLLPRNLVTKISRKLIGR